MPASAGGQIDTRDSGDRSSLSPWVRGGDLKLDSSTLSGAKSLNMEGDIKGRHSLLRAALRLCQREAAPTNDF